MRAILYTRYGPPENLHIEEVEEPIPKENEVLVRVHASSINSWDWDLLRGKPTLIRLGAPRPRYSILGADIAGVVEALGKDVKRLQVGDEVFGDISGCNWGGFAEYTCADELVLAKKLPGMTFELAAALPQAGVLALQSLRDKGRIGSGQKILINGAGGGVGTLAIQISRSYGAEVTAVDSAEKLEMLSAVGADHVIDYRETDFTRTGDNYDLILDVVANRPPSAYRRALSENGTFVMIGGSGSTAMKIMLFGSRNPERPGKKMFILMHKPRREDLETLNGFFESGELVPVIDRVCPLERVPEALQYLGESRVKGKIVITMEDDS